MGDLTSCGVYFLWDMLEKGFFFFFYQIHWWVIGELSSDPFKCFLSSISVLLFGGNSGFVKRDIFVQHTCEASLAFWVRINHFVFCHPCARFLLVFTFPTVIQARVPHPTRWRHRALFIFVSPGPSCLLFSYSWFLHQPPNQCVFSANYVSPSGTKGKNPDVVFDVSTVEWMSRTGRKTNTHTMQLAKWYLIKLVIVTLHVRLTRYPPCSVLMWLFSVRTQWSRTLIPTGQALRGQVQNYQMWQLSTGTQSCGCTE